MGYGHSLQKAVDIVEEGGVYVGRWPAVGACDEERRDDKLGQRRSDRRFYVLAFEETSIRLVCRTRLRVQLRPRAGAGPGDYRWAIDSHSLENGIKTKQALRATCQYAVKIFKAQSLIATLPVPVPPPVASVEPQVLKSAQGRV